MNRRIGRDDGHAVQDRLCDETAVKRVPVKWRETSIVGCTILFEGKRSNPKPLPAAFHIDVGR